MGFGFVVDWSVIDGRFNVVGSTAVDRPGCDLRSEGGRPPAAVVQLPADQDHAFRSLGGSLVQQFQVIFFGNGRISWLSDLNDLPEMYLASLLVA